jgi:hypothetical protein
VELLSNRRTNDVGVRVGNGNINMPIFICLRRNENPVTARKLCCFMVVKIINFCLRRNGNPVTIIDE